MAIRVAAILVIAYLLGNLNGSILISRIFAHEDVRSHGSGNAGLTNFVRNYGGITAVLVVLIDVGKAVAACLLGKYLLGSLGRPMEGLALGAVGVTLGHDFPALLGFRGGKGILCGGTIAFMLGWQCGLLVIGVFALVYLIFGFVSLGSVLAALTTTGYVLIVFHSQPVVMILLGALGLLAVFMHRSNIRRLLNGTEPKTSFFKKK